MCALLKLLLDWLKSLFWKKEMKLTLVGRQCSGKTTFANVVASGQFSSVTTPTAGFFKRRITKGNVTINVWDMGGQQKYISMWEKFCRGVNAIVFMVDSANQDIIEFARKDLHNLLEKPRLQGIPVLVLGNKRDLPGALDRNGIIQKMKLDLIQDREICCHSISCKEKVNINRPLQWLKHHSTIQR